MPSTYPNSSHVDKPRLCRAPCQGRPDREVACRVCRAMNLRGARLLDLDRGSRRWPVQPVRDHTGDLALAIPAGLQIQVVGKLGGGGPAQSGLSRSPPAQQLRTSVPAHRSEGPSQGFRTPAWRPGAPAPQIATQAQSRSRSASRPGRMVAKINHAQLVPLAGGQSGVSVHHFRSPGDAPLLRSGAGARNAGISPSRPSTK